jgi:hypothetical protein
MAAVPHRLQFDRRVPFIDAIFRVIDGSEPVQPAVDALVQSEVDVGVVIVGDPIPIYMRSDLSDLVDNYDRWVQTVFEVLREKNAQLARRAGIRV